MTDQTSEAGAPFGPQAIADHWAAHGVGCSRQYAQKCIRKLGCPTSSLAEALAWRTGRTRVGSRSGGAGRASTPTGKNEPQNSVTRRVDPPAEILGDTLDAVLARARQAELEQYRTYLSAVASGDLHLQNAALRNHKDAQQNLIAVEQMVFEAKKERGEFVNLPAAQQRILDRLGPLQAARPSLSRVLAMELFPEAPHRAQPRIEEHLARLLDPALKTAAKPLVEPSAAAETAAAAIQASAA